MKPEHDEDRRKRERDWKFKEAYAIQSCECLHD